MWAVSLREWDGPHREIYSFDSGTYVRNKLKEHINKLYIRYIKTILQEHTSQFREILMSAIILHCTARYYITLDYNILHYTTLLCASVYNLHNSLSTFFLFIRKYRRWRWRWKTKRKRKRRWQQIHLNHSLKFKKEK